MEQAWEEGLPIIIPLLLVSQALGLGSVCKLFNEVRPMRFIRHIGTSVFRAIATTYIDANSRAPVLQGLWEHAASLRRVEVLWEHGWPEDVGAATIELVSRAGRSQHLTALIVQLPTTYTSELAHVLLNIPPPPPHRPPLASRLCEVGLSTVTFDAVHTRGGVFLMATDVHVLSCGSRSDSARAAAARLRAALSVLFPRVERLVCDSPLVYPDDTTTPAVAGQPPLANLTHIALKNFIESTTFNQVLPSQYRLPAGLQSVVLLLLGAWRLFYSRRHYREWHDWLTNSTVSPLPGAPATGGWTLTVLLGASGIGLTDQLVKHALANPRLRLFAPSASCDSVPPADYPTAIPALRMLFGQQISSVWPLTTAASRRRDWSDSDWIRETELSLPALFSVREHSEEPLELFCRTLDLGEVDLRDLEEASRSGDVALCAGVRLPSLQTLDIALQFRRRTHQRKRQTQVSSVFRFNFTDSDQHTDSATAPPPDSLQHLVPGKRVEAAHMCLEEPVWLPRINSLFAGALTCITMMSTATTHTRIDQDPQTSRWVQHAALTPRVRTIQLAYAGSEQLGTAVDRSEMRAWASWINALPQLQEVRVAREKVGTVTEAARSVGRDVKVVDIRARDA